MAHIFQFLLSYQKKRIFKIISKAKADIIICNSNKISFYKKIFPKKIFFTEKNLTIKENNHIKAPSKNNKLAYIIFTSGSTGELRVFVFQENH